MSHPFPSSSHQSSDEAAIREMHKLQSAFETASEFLWFVPLTAKEPREGEVKLARPSAPAPVPVQRRTPQDISAQAEATAIAQMQHEAAAARRATNIHESSATVGSPVKRGPMSRRRSEQLVSPGSYQRRSELLTGGTHERSNIVLVDSDDPMVHVKIPGRIMADDIVTVKSRRSLPGLIPLAAVEEDDDLEVTVSQDRLSKIQNWRLMEALKESSSSGHKSLAASSRESIADLHRSASISELMPPPSTIATGTGANGTATAPPGTKRSSTSRPRIEVIDLDDDELQPNGAAEDLAIRRAEEFIALQRSAVRTSNNTLAEETLLSRQERTEIFEGLPPMHATECACLIEKYKRRFRGWLAELYAGFNLLFYGAGSKIDLLDSFAKEVLKNCGPVVVLLGHHPTTTVRTLLTLISRDALSLPLQPADPTTHLASIAKELAKKVAPHVFIVLHGIDGKGLRGRVSQVILAELAAMEKVHLVASFEHRMTPYAWDTVLVSHFNWLWSHIPTYAAYNRELRFDQVFGGTAGELISEGAGAIVVLSSVPRSTRIIFQLLADHQLKNLKEKAGIQLQRFATLCKDELLCDDATFNSAARELFEHRIFIKSKNKQGEECVRLRMTPTTIAQVMAHLKATEEIGAADDSESDEPDDDA